MRVLFSSTRGAGHLQPLLPYARALVARRHEVAVAGAGLTLIEPDADALRAAVQTALDGPELRLRARGLAEEIAAMPTIDDVVDAMVGLS